jgi:hypothetical protein
MAKTANRLLDGLKRRITMPASQVLLLDSDILEIADDVTQSKLLPLIMSTRQDFFVTVTEIASVPGQAAYSIPYRAIGRTLRDLKIKSSGSTRDVNLIALEDEHMFLFASEPEGFYFRGDKIVLIPAPSNPSLVIQQWWLCPPGKLVKTDDAGFVTSFDSTTVTVSSVPGTITTGTVVDFIAGKSGNSTLGFDATVTNVSGNVITFGAGVIPSDLVTGDYVSVAQTTPVIQLPDECYRYLETETAISCLKAIGDAEGAAALESVALEEAKNVKIMLEPRIEGESTKIINRRSLLRGSRYRYRRGFTW